MNWMYSLYEWTWHLNSFGNILWGFYLGGNAFAWLLIPLGLMVSDTDEKHPYRNTFGVWIIQLALFLLIGVIGCLVYNL